MCLSHIYIHSYIHIIIWKCVYYIHISLIYTYTTHIYTYTTYTYIYHSALAARLFTIFLLRTAAPGTVVTNKSCRLCAQCVALLLCARCTVLCTVLCMVHSTVHSFMCTVLGAQFWVFRYTVLGFKVHSFMHGALYSIRCTYCALMLCAICSILRITWAKSVCTVLCTTQHVVHSIVYNIYKYMLCTVLRTIYINIYWTLMHYGLGVLCTYTYSE